MPGCVRRRLRAAGLLVGVSLYACTVGPDFERPAQPTQNGYTSETVELGLAAGKETKQSLAVGKQISGQWWQLFHAKRLDAVLDQALKGNLSLVAAEATLAQAKDAVDQASGAMWPHVQLTGGVSRQQTNQATLGINSPHVVSNLYTIGPNVSYALDLFGGYRRQVEQQLALAEYQEYQLDAAFLTLTGNIVTEAIAIASAREQLKVIDGMLAEDERNIGALSELLAVGQETKTALEQARTQLASDRALIPPLRQQLATATHAMSVLVGRAPVDWTPPNFDLTEFTLPGELPVSLPSAIVRQRPDILAVEAQLHAASAQIGVATAAMYPNITLNASLAQQALTTGTLFSGASTVWSIGSQLTAPIFEGGALEAQRQATVNAFKAQTANYQQTVLTAFGQVADVLSALQNDAQLASDEQQATASAEAARQLVRETLRSGSVTVLEVLDAERQYAQHRLAYTKAKAQRLLDTAQLFNAMGGGWWDWRAKQIGVVATRPLRPAVSER